MYRKLIISALLFLGASGIGFAQTNVSLPFLLLNPDARTSGMGNVTPSSGRGLHIYTSPTVMLTDDAEKVHVAYGVGVFPKVEDSREVFNVLSLGYRLSERHAILAGFRHFGGLKVNGLDLNGTPGVYRPSDFSVDLGYAFRLNPSFSLSVRGSYVGAQGAYATNTALVSLGANYRHEGELAQRPIRYSVSLGVDNLGPKFKYSGMSETSYNPPSSVGLGGEVSMDPHMSDRLTLGLSAKYFFLSGYKAPSAMVGAEYSFLNRSLSLRGGYEWAMGHNDGATLGIGYRYRMVSLDVAYRIQTGSGYNSMHCGLAFDF